MWQLQGAPQEVAQQIGSHDAPVKAVGFLPNSNMVVSGGWDKKVRVVTSFRYRRGFFV
jgi:mRNA export factor